MSVQSEELIILLHIVEAIGLDTSHEGVRITATLGGNRLETENAKPGKQIIFNNSLMWETDKKSIKSMKTENLPIKVEAFTSYFVNGQEIRSLIGFIIIPIRTVPQNATRKGQPVNPHWHRLLGLTPEWKEKKPELLLYTTITIKENIRHGEIIQTTTVENEQPVDLEPCYSNHMLRPRKGLHIELLQKEGLLQVGDVEKNCDIFIVRIIFKSARNLEYIVNSEQDMDMLFRLHYNLLGTPTHCMLGSKGKSLYGIQEKIAIHFRSSLSSLNEYFNKVLYVPIEVYYNDTVVGHAKFKFKNLIPTTSLPEFLSRYANEHHYMEIENTLPIQTLIDLPPTSPLPHIEYAFGLKYLSTMKVTNYVPDTQETPRMEQVGTETLDSQAGGDPFSKGLELPPTNDYVDKEEDGIAVKYIQSDSVLAAVRGNEMQTEAEINPKLVRSDVVVAKPPERLKMDSLLDISTTAKDAQRTYSFNLVVQELKFNSSPEKGIWQISICHPRAETPFKVENIEMEEINSNTIKFDQLELQLLFISTADDLVNILQADSCVLNLKGPRNVHASAELDNEILLVSTTEKRAGIILLEDKLGEKLTMAHIYVYVDDLGISLNTQMKKHLPMPCSIIKPINEHIAYKFIEELEQWKVTAEEDFMVELKRKEIAHLALLTAEWQKKKIEQETLLAEKLEQCSQLAGALEKANKDVQEKGIDKIEQEKMIEQARIEIERTYCNKVLELSEKARRLEDDMNHNLKMEQLKYQQLEMNKNLLQQENQKLKNEIRRLDDELNEIKKSYLPREQLSGLFQDMRILSERLEEVQNSKLFYKDQWAKIIREVHRMKMENIQGIEQHLKHWKLLDFEHFLSNEQTELCSEKCELDIVKNILDADGSYQIDLDSISRFYHSNN